MRSPHLSRLRAAADAAPLPAGLTLVLLLALAAQIALPIEAELPEAELGPPRAPAARAVTLAPVAVYPQLARRNPFAPGGARASSAADGADLTLLGLARSGRGASAVVSSNGRTASLTPGEAIGGWRLIAVGRNSALLAGPQGRRTLRVGESLAPVAPPASTPSEQPEE